MYDVLNKLYVDAILPYEFDEREAAEAMIKRYDGAPAILTADRGYPSYNLMETVNRNPLMEYLIRTPNSNIILMTLTAQAVRFFLQKLCGARRYRSKQLFMHTHKQGNIQRRKNDG